MKNKPVYRHELKFLISEQQKESILRRIQMIMEADSHASDGGYMIRSLYFDDAWENAYAEKLAGTKSRQKYRIRCYDGNNDVIKLERKRKEGQYINKVADSLTVDEFYKILDGDVEFLRDPSLRLRYDFYNEIVGNLMRPKIIVDYEREPYVFPYGDVRITFDSHVRAAVTGYDIFNMELPVLEVLPQGMLIMEVKFTEFLPKVIQDILPTQDTIYTAASKYVMCLEKQKELT